MGRQQQQSLPSRGPLGLLTPGSCPSAHGENLGMDIQTLCGLLTSSPTLPYTHLTVATLAILGSFAHLFPSAWNAVAPTPSRHLVNSRTSFRLQHKCHHLQEAFLDYPLDQTSPPVTYSCSIMEHFFRTLSTIRHLLHTVPEWVYKKLTVCHGETDNKQ